jgi:hypothetical protein
MKSILLTAVFLALLSQCLCLIIAPVGRAVIVPSIVPSVVGPVIAPVARVIPVVPLVRRFPLARPFRARLIIKRESENQVNQTVPTEPVCTLTRNLLDCEGLEHNFACQVTPQLEKFNNLTLNLTGLVGKSLVHHHTEMLLLENTSAPVDKKTEENFTFVHGDNEEKGEFLWILPHQVEAHSGFVIKDEGCYSQLLSLTKGNSTLRFTIDL